MQTATKENKSQLLRARCIPALKQDVIDVAKLQHLDEADIIRMACAVFVQQFKKPNLTHGR